MPNVWTSGKDEGVKGTTKTERDGTEEKSKTWGNVCDEVQPYALG